MRVVAALVCALLSACTNSPDSNRAPATPAASTPAVVEIPRSTGHPVGGIKGGAATGDLDAIAERGNLRILVAASRTHFEVDKDVQRGRTVDAGIAFEAMLNQRAKPRKVAVVFIPTPEDALVRDLLSGKGDIAANLLLTFERDDQVAFAAPVRSGIRELIVTGPNEPPLVSLEDIGGRTVHVRRASDHHASLVRLNEQLKKINRPPAKIVFLAPVVTDEDALSHMNMGADIPATVVDDYVYDMWAKTFDKVKVNRDVAVSQDGVIAWATRKDAPTLLALINEFFTTHRLTF